MTLPGAAMATCNRTNASSPSASTVRPASSGVSVKTLGPTMSTTTSHQRHFSPPPRRRRHHGEAPAGLRRLRRRHLLEILRRGPPGRQAVAHPGAEDARELRTPPSSGVERRQPVVLDQMALPADEKRCAMPSITRKTMISTVMRLRSARSEICTEARPRAAPAQCALTSEQGPIPAFGNAFPNLPGSAISPSRNASARPCPAASVRSGSY